jgi:hypothetical protein
MSLLAIAEALEAAAAKLREAAARDTETLPLPLENDGWKEWAGGEQPPETYGMRVDVTFAGDNSDNVRPSMVADVLDWSHTNAVDDITRYRLSAVQPDSQSA